MNSAVRVGIGVFVWKDSKFLMGMRRGAHGYDTWSVPGGHLEFGESWEECAKREVREETSLEIANIRFLAATNNIFKEERKHSVTIWMQSDWQSGSPTITEPDKFISMEWLTFASLPRPLFLPWEQLRKTVPHLFNP